MQVRFLRQYTLASTIYRKGMVADLSPQQAVSLIEDGIAERMPETYRKAVRTQKETR